ncbi:hypothetical protein [Caulobacter mirabilis]|uniref:Uncharacterized protein n=1 Tax=Caulobacter mirabilis TaxID=69666 RepID=A0A2D2AV09_9CAUL|nr:hypothetical protein [Caulobacter mirabilis]ATQ41862.1 hypothetical protein CSW64_05260 [Caulobacter mirabilis]
MDEYAALLTPGMRTVDLDEATRTRVLAAARSVWPQTGFKRWEALSRRVELAAQTADGRTVLAHVTADWKDCFVIILLDRSTDSLEAFFVFDIGAEYRPLTLECPGLRDAGELTPEVIERAVAGLGVDDDSYLILDAGEGTYMQAARREEGVVVEFQLATVQNHFKVAAPVNDAVAIELLTSYAFGRKEWASRVDWRPLFL